MAVACRILAHAGLIEDVLGHVSVRVDDDTILVRARGPAEAGVLFTEPADVIACSIATGRPLAETAWSPPNELPIHLACYRDDPAIGAVVHAHPPAVVAADLAGLPLVPLVGAYHIPAARLAADGIATFPRAVLINTDELAHGDARRDGRPPGVRAARPRDHGDRRHPRGRRRERPRRRRPRPDGRAGRPHRRPADGATRRRAGAAPRPRSRLQRPAAVALPGAPAAATMGWPSRGTTSDRRRHHRREHPGRDDPGQRLQRSRRVRAGA